MKEFIAANGGLIATAAMAMIAINLVLSGLKAGLEKIKDKTASDVDNKIYAAISAVSGFLSKILDVIGYNPEHKDEPKK
jgi:hypothetical protein